MSELDGLLELEPNNHGKPAEEMSEVNYGKRLLEELINQGVIGSWHRVEDPENVRAEIRQKHDDALRTKLR